MLTKANGPARFLPDQAKLLEAVASGEKLSALLEVSEARSDKVTASEVCHGLLPRVTWGVLGEH